MPERLTSATVISGMGPVDHPEALTGMMGSMRLGLGLARSARTVPDCEARFYPGQGHTLIYHYWREILTVAVA